MPQKNKYVFGPVPSRRLGRSLGVDIVPFKVCTLNCIYCQLGKTPKKTIQRKDYVPLQPVLDELKEKLDQGVKPDFITVSGSGEPTLNSRLGEFIDGIKKITDIPVAILTNGTLLTDKAVRYDCAKADLVVPSLDAADEQTFQKINRPHTDISIEKLVEGLSEFRNEFAGRIWLEVFLVKDLNTDPEQIKKIKKLIERIRPEKIHLNTAVRPTAEKHVGILDEQKLRTIADELGENCEVVADFLPAHHGKHTKISAEDVLSILKRRPCSLNDIFSSLAITPDLALKLVTSLQQQGLIRTEQRDNITFFKANLI